MERNEVNPHGQEERHGNPDKDGNQNKEVQGQPLMDRAHRHLSEIDRREGEMDHGETGGNFREEQTK